MTDANKWPIKAKEEDENTEKEMEGGGVGAVGGGNVSTTVLMSEATSGLNEDDENGIVDVIQTDTSWSTVLLPTVLSNDGTTAVGPPPEDDSLLVEEIVAGLDDNYYDDDENGRNNASIRGRDDVIPNDPKNDDYFDQHNTEEDVQTIHLAQNMDTVETEESVEFRRPIGELLDNPNEIPDLAKIFNKENKEINSTEDFPMEEQRKDEDKTTQLSTSQVPPFPIPSPSAKPRTPGILRLDSSGKKSRRSSGFSSTVEFRNDPEMLGEVITRIHSLNSHL